MTTDWYCFTHNDFDIRKRHHGEYRCSDWAGPDDDVCVIHLARIIDVGDTDLNDLPEPNRTVR